MSWRRLPWMLLGVGSLALAARQVDVGSVRARWWSRNARQPLSVEERAAVAQGGQVGADVAWKLLAQELPAPEAQVVGWLAAALEEEPARWPWAQELARSRPQQVRLFGAGLGLARFRAEAGLALAELRLAPPEVDGLAGGFLATSPDPWTSAQLDLRAYEQTGWRPPGWPDSLVQALMVSPPDDRRARAAEVLALLNVSRTARYAVGSDALAVAYRRAEQACAAPAAWDCAASLGSLVAILEEDRLAPVPASGGGAGPPQGEPDLPAPARPLSAHLGAWAEWVTQADGPEREDRLLLASRWAYPAAHHEAAAANLLELAARIGMKVEVRQVGSTLVVETPHRSWTGERCRPVGWVEGRLPGGEPAQLPPWWLPAAIDLRESGRPFLALGWLGQAQGGSCSIDRARSR